MKGEREPCGYLGKTFQAATITSDFKWEDAWCVSRTRRRAWRNTQKGDTKEGMVKDVPYTRQCQAWYASVKPLDFIRSKMGSHNK